MKDNAEELRKKMVDVLFMGGMERTALRKISVVVV